ncbi:hypothetical protein NT26_3891 [Pseudorhizobium banfieldiae]|uniref:Uncharacterized protein n=1 Tax=Pseudorhizobium banfieldiae TaxID=1125847 RepID=L0NJ34_9HYPH|nr:hypothetical protein NT26_3368 [Pseudorhizobium banfieldiae]CCF21613.1 hypothetical protein NT26_3891 [Pseudorhizobium banfieldiae]
MFQFPAFASYPYVFRIRYLITMLGNLFGPVLTLPRSSIASLRTARRISADGLAPVREVPHKPSSQLNRFPKHLRWVAPFGDPWIKAHSQLPTAYRSVSRPSSPVHAKASTKCPYDT